MSGEKQAVKMHLEEGMTNAEILKTLGIVDERRVRKWCEIYRKYGVINSPSSKPKGWPRKYERSPQKEIAHLRMKIELLRNFAYEAARR
jgi:transposase